MNKVLEFFTSFFAKKNLVIAVLGAAVILLIMLHVQSCNASKNKDALIKQDSEAMKKELVTEKNKSGLLQTSVVAFEGKVSEIGNYSKDLEKQIKDLKNRAPSVIIKTRVVYAGDTVEVPNSLIDKGDGKYELPWKYMSADSTKELEGKSSFKATVDFNKTDFSYKMNVVPGFTTITKDKLKLDFTVGVAKNKKTGFDEIFVTPADPHVTIGKLEGAIINPPKNKLFAVTMSLGYGVVYSNGNFGLGPYFGLGVSRTLFKF